MRALARHPAVLLPLRTTPSVAEQEGQLMEMEVTRAPQEYYHTLNQQVGGITQSAIETIP